MANAVGSEQPAVTPGRGLVHGPRADRRSSQRAVPLEQALWQRLVSARSLKELAPGWLALQCGMIDGVARAVVVQLGPAAERNGIAVWPEGSRDMSGLSSAVDLALSQKRGIVQRPDEAGRPDSIQIAYPLQVGGAPVGAVALEIDGARAAPPRQAMRAVQWGTAWLREKLVQERAEAAQRLAERSGTALELLATGLEEERFAAACRALVTEIALRAGCDRVSVGFRRNGSCVVEAVSHSAQSGKRMNLVHLLGAAMDEAMDQQAVLLYPPLPDDPHVTRAHEELARAHAAGTILTTPLFVRDAFVGAVSYERAADRAFSRDEIEYLEGVAAVVGPLLEEKRHNDRWLLVKAGAALLSQLRRLLGPGYFKRKLAALGLIVSLVFFSFAHADYRISADAVVEGRVQRAVVAAFDGFIKDATVRAGDRVTRDELMARLDDRDLLLRRLGWVTERQKSVYEYERALGEGNRAESRIARTRIEQAEAHIALLDEQIARTRMTAPFDGLVVAGDLSQSIGAAVQRGQLLFEVAPLDAFRVILKVDETQIRDAQRGGRGRLRVSSLPDETFPVVIDTLTPVAVAEAGRNFFRVEAHVEGGTDRLRPGMSGVVRIDVAERRLIWIWTRTLTDWLRVTAWRWFG